MKNHDRVLFKTILIAFGSWWSIIIHTLIFLFFIFVVRDNLIFTTVVSIEAIYIGIFILMAESREEEAKERRELERRSKDRKLVKEDVSLTEKDVYLTENVVEEIKAIKALQVEMNHMIKDLGIQKTQETNTTTP